MTEYFEQGLKAVLAADHYAPAKRSNWTPATDDNTHECWQYMGPGQGGRMFNGDWDSRVFHQFRHRNHPKYGRAYAYVRRENWGWDGFVKAAA